MSAGIKEDTDILVYEGPSSKAVNWKYLFRGGRCDVSLIKLPASFQLSIVSKYAFSPALHPALQDKRLHMYNSFPFTLFIIFGYSVVKMELSILHGSTTACLNMDDANKFVFSLFLKTLISFFFLNENLCIKVLQLGRKCSFHFFYVLLKCLTSSQVTTLVVQ